MKAFFMEYGKLIITGALTVTGLMFSTPFAEAVTGTVANFTSRFSGKNEESLEEVYIGPRPIIDGTNVVLTDVDGDGVASKGDTITFAREYLYSGSNTGPTEFLVLNTNGSDVELLATSKYQKSNFNTSSVTTTDVTPGSNPGKLVQKYEGSTLDTLLNTTYYNSLSDTVKGKIKSKSITQNTWQVNGTPAEATVSALDGTPYTYKKTGTVGTYKRNVYALDVQDIIDYLGTSFTGAQLNKMFFNTETVQYGKYALLRSASYFTDNSVIRVNGDFGGLNHTKYSYSNYEARPAFTITLN